MLARGTGVRPLALADMLQLDKARHTTQRGPKRQCARMRHQRFSKRRGFSIGTLARHLSITNSQLAHTRLICRLQATHRVDLDDAHAQRARNGTVQLMHRNAIVGAASMVRVTNRLLNATTLALWEIAKTKVRTFHLALDLIHLLVAFERRQAHAPDTGGTLRHVVR